MALPTTSTSVGNKNQAMPTSVGSTKIGPTVPKVHIGSKYVRAGLRGETVTPNNVSTNNPWHISNSPQMKMHKSANLSPEAKHELVSTGTIAGMGVASGVLGHKLMGTKIFQRAASHLSPAMQSGLAVGGLGLIGDYGAVKINKAIEGSSNTTGKVNTMNKVANILLGRATELRQATPEIVAVELLKQAGMAEQDARYEVAQQLMEKAAAEELTYKGIDAEDAVKMVKAANINVRELPGVELTTEEEALAEVLEKAAAYIEAQSGRIEELEKSAGQVREVVREVEVPAKPALPDQITKMAGVGALSFEDVEALKSIPAETLTKVASAMETPWEFGKAAGVSAEAADPILAFCMGN